MILGLCFDLVVLTVFAGAAWWFIENVLYRKEKDNGKQG